MKSTEERLKGYEPLWENWYYTGEMLGIGGMSSVFEIVSDNFGTKEYCALKIITVTGTADGKINVPTNALNEINILRSLSDCPNIVTYHDSTNRKIYDESGNVVGIDILIRMEKLKPLSEGDKFDEKRVISLANDMCTALESAEKKDIIHRDIKPQNIFVDEDGVFKLGDFGVAKMVSESSLYYTKEIGTLAYCAPEVSSDSGDVRYDASSDIYSLGLVLYIYLNDGYMPFMDSGTSLKESIFKRLKGTPFLPPKNGSPEIKKIVMRALEFDAKRRYRNAREMLDDLEVISMKGNKKYILDPYSTIDANIGEILAEYEEVIEIKPEESKDKGGIFKKGGGLKIGSAFKSSPMAKEVKFEEKSESEVKKESKLKIGTFKRASDKIESVSEPPKDIAPKIEVSHADVKIKETPSTGLKKSPSLKGGLVSKGTDESIGATFVSDAVKEDKVESRIKKSPGFKKTDSTEVKIHEEKTADKKTEGSSFFKTPKL